MKKALADASAFLVEHRGFEPLTPTLPVLCAPSCANAPNIYIIHDRCGFVNNLSKKSFPFFKKNRENRGQKGKAPCFLREEEGKTVDKKAKVWYNTLCMYN